MAILPPQPIYANKQQIPVTQIKNNKKIKNNSIKNNKQNKKNEDDDIEEVPEETFNKINEIKKNNNSINEFNMLRNNNNLVIDKMPQIINSFYYVNNNNVNNFQAQYLKDKEKFTNSNDTSVNYNEELSNNNNINSVNNNSSLKNKKLIKKSKPRKYNCIFTKNVLSILENMSITNEDKLLYILTNFKNIRIDPLIIKVLEERKTKKRIGLYESMLSEEQNTSSNIEKEKNKNEIANNNNTNNNQNNTQNNQVSHTPPQQVSKPTFPMDDKILFSDLEKYNISE